MYVKIGIPPSFGFIFPFFHFPMPSLLLVCMFLLHGRWILKVYILPSSMNEPLDVSGWTSNFKTMRKCGRWSESSGWIQFICLRVYFLAYVYAKLVMHAFLVSCARLGVAQLHMTSIKTRGNSELIRGTEALNRNVSQPPSIFRLQPFFLVIFLLLSRQLLPSWMQINTVRVCLHRHGFPVPNSVQLQCSHKVKDVRRHRCGLVSIHRVGSDPDVMKRLLVGKTEAAGVTRRQKKWRVLQWTQEIVRSMES